MQYYLLVALQICRIPIIHYFTPHWTIKGSSEPSTILRLNRALQLCPIKPVPHGLFKPCPPTLPMLKMCQSIPLGHFSQHCICASLAIKSIPLANGENNLMKLHTTFSLLPCTEAD